MEKEIVVTKRFKQNTERLYTYLLTEYSSKTAYQFLNRLEQRVQFISHYPEAGKPSQKSSDIRSFLLYPHNRIYYRITSNRIVPI